MEIQRVGVVGAGIMGRGVALNLAQTGHHVVLVDVAATILEEARRKIHNDLRLQRLFNKNDDLRSADEVLQRLEFAAGHEALHRVDFVIENVTERWPVKERLYPQLDAVCPPACILAANTSTMPITRLAGLTGRARQVIGMHFMNPVSMIATVEVIRGYHTSDDTVEKAEQLLARMGKKAIVVKDAPGFVTNRVLMVTINEAIYLLHEQIASAADVDQLFKSCFGHKMGPLETADLIGLDTILYSIESLHENFNDSKYRPCPLLKTMVAAGLLGRKSGQGFYRYPV